MRKIKYLYAVSHRGLVPVYRVKVLKDCKGSFIVLGVMPHRVKKSNMIRKNISYFYSERAAEEFEEDVLNIRRERMQRKQGCDES